MAREKLLSQGYLLPDPVWVKQWRSCMSSPSPGMGQDQHGAPSGVSGDRPVDATVGAMSAGVVPRTTEIPASSVEPALKGAHTSYKECGKKQKQEDLFPKLQE